MPLYSQTPGPMSFAFRRGDSWGALVDFDPVALTGYSIAAQMSSTITGAAVQSLTTTVTDAAAGRVNVSLTSQQTAGLVPGTYGWSLTWVDAAGLTRTALQGTVEVLP